MAPARTAQLDPQRDFEALRAAARRRFLARARRAGQQAFHDLDDAADEAYQEAWLGQLYGGSSPDRVSGGAGSDKLYGGSGGDRLTGGGGRDLIYGGSGPDRIFARDGRRDAIYCGSGNDSAEIDAIDYAATCE